MGGGGGGGWGPFLMGLYIGLTVLPQLEKNSADAYDYKEVCDISCIILCSPKEILKTDATWCVLVSEWSGSVSATSRILLQK